MSITHTKDDVWVSKAEACRLLGCDVRALARLMMANKIVTRRLAKGIRETVSLASIRRVQAEAMAGAK
jgi:hypothetical protein